MGHKSIPPEVKRSVTAAMDVLSAAERELESAMRAIETAERADKKIISEVLQAAFDKVAAARMKLDAVLRDD